MRAHSLFLLLLLLSACDREQPAPVQPQRIALDEVRTQPLQPLASPDTEEAGWHVTADGQAIGFGNQGAPPFLTLACRITDNPPELSIVRHTLARPGEKALFPVIGNGMIARFKLDATFADNEWRWEGAVPADDTLLEVFTGTRDIEATLPGAGTLLIEGSRIPGEFIRWCRAGGGVREAVTREQAEDQG